MVLLDIASANYLYGMDEYKVEGEVTGWSMKSELVLSVRSIKGKTNQQNCFGNLLDSKRY